MFKEVSLPAALASNTGQSGLCNFQAIIGSTVNTTYAIQFATAAFPPPPKPPPPPIPPPPPPPRPPPPPSPISPYLNFTVNLAGAGSAQGADQQFLAR